MTFLPAGVQPLVVLHNLEVNKIECGDAAAIFKTAKSAQATKKKTFKIINAEGVVMMEVGPGTSKQGSTMISFSPGFSCHT